MAMGRGNQRQRQKGLWGAAADLPHTAAHPFYRRLGELLDERVVQCKMSLKMI